MEQLSDVGLIGLGVMGENLALNMERNGRRVSVWNRTVPGVEEGVAERFVEGRAAGKQILGFSDLSEFVASLNRPRIIMMMVRAGNAVDELIDQVSPFLAEGDVLIDGGNSDYVRFPYPPSTASREKLLAALMDCCLSGQEFPAGQREPFGGLPSCRAERKRLGR